LTAKITYNPTVQSGQ